jgi:hypothetical protein
MHVIAPAGSRYIRPCSRAGGPPASRGTELNMREGGGGGGGVYILETLIGSEYSIIKLI